MNATFLGLRLLSMESLTDTKCDLMVTILRPSSFACKGPVCFRNQGHIITSIRSQATEIRDWLHWPQIFRLEIPFSIFSSSAQSTESWIHCLISSTHFRRMTLSFSQFSRFASPFLHEIEFSPLCPARARSVVAPAAVFNGLRVKENPFRTNRSGAISNT